MKIKSMMLLAGLLAGSSISLQADEYEADRQIMRAMLADLEQALNQQDFDGVLKHMHEDVVVTYYNAEVTRGHDEARDYYQRMLQGGEAVLREYSTRGEVGGPAVFHGDTAVAYGSTVESFKLAAGLEFTLNGRWSTTLRKADDRWRVIALHFSADLFDNPLLNNTKRANWIAGAIAFVAGGLLVFLLLRMRRKKA